MPFVGRRPCVQETSRSVLGSGERGVPTAGACHLSVGPRCGRPVGSRRPPRKRAEPAAAGSRAPPGACREHRPGLPEGAAGPGTSTWPGAEASTEHSSTQNLVGSHPQVGRSSGALGVTSTQLPAPSPGPQQTFVYLFHSLKGNGGREISICCLLGCTIQDWADGGQKPAKGHLPFQSPHPCEPVRGVGPLLSQPGRVESVSVFCPLPRGVLYSGCVSHVRNS